MDQIPGASPTIKGGDTKKYEKLPFKPNAASLLIPKRFKMPDIPRCDGTMDSHKHVELYTTGINVNDMQLDKIESVMLKQIGQMLTKGALTWYTLLPKHSIDSLLCLQIFS